MSEQWLKAEFRYTFLSLPNARHRCPHGSEWYPAMPSPLTVEMAMLASYLREGQADKAQQLLDLMPLTVKRTLAHPKGAIIYRSIMRYVRPPKDSAKIMTKIARFWPANFTAL